MIPVTRNDFIYVDFISILAAADITVTALVQLKDGKITKYERNFLLTTANVAQINTFRLTSGILIALTVRDTLRTIDWGALHATCGISRTDASPVAGDQPDLVQLSTGYVSRSHQISFPTGSNLPILAGKGLHRVQGMAQPDAGAELTFTTAANQLRRFFGIRFKFQSSAIVATRRVNFNIRTGINNFFLSAADNSQLASKTVTYNWFSGVNEMPLNDNVYVGTAPLIMLPKGTTLETITTNIQAGDQFTVGVILFEDFITTN